MIDFMRNKQWFFLFSAIAIVISIITLAVFGLQPGIDFTGGTSMTLRFNPQVSQEELRQELTTFGHAEAIIQSSGDDFLIRMKEIVPSER
jgi:preprotein translocase subunit SecF